MSNASGRKPKKARTSGYICPKCVVPLKVAYTRTLTTEVIRRCRECPHCDHVLITEERPRRTN